MMIDMTTQATEARTDWVPTDSWGTRLLIARTQLGLTQQQAADRSNVNRATWALWERTGSTPRDMVNVGRDIAEGLGLNLNWLLFGGPLRPERGHSLGGGMMGVSSPAGVVIPFRPRMSRHFAFPTRDEVRTVG